MHKNFSLAASVFFLTISFSCFGQLKLGVKAGLSANQASYQVEHPGPGVDAEAVEKTGRESIRWKSGYTVGLAAEYGITEALSLQTGLELSRKGYKIKFEKTETNDSRTLTRNSKGKSAVSYLEIPLNLAYKIKAVQLHAGPYLGVGLAGKGAFTHKYSLTSPWESQHGETTWAGNYIFKTRIKDSDPAYLRFRQEYVQRLDAGVNLGLSYSLGAVLLSATYTQGLRNLQPPYNENEENLEVNYKNKGIRLTATWYFRNF